MQLRVLQAAADRRLPVVLPDAHADDPGGRDVDRALPRQADHAAGADAGGGRARNRRRPSRSAARAGNRRRVRLAGRGVQQHGGRAGGQPPEARTVDATTSAQAPRGRRPAALYRDHARAHCHRRHLGRRRRPDHHDQRRGRAPARPRSVRRSAARRTTCSPGAISRRCSTLLHEGAARPRRAAGAGDRARCATVARCTWPPWPAPLHGESAAAGGRRARVRRRDAAHPRRRRWRPGGRWRGGSRTRSRTR